MTRKPKQPMTRRELSAINNFYSLASGKGPVEVPAARAPSRDLEHKEQVAVIQWWANVHRMYALPEFALFAIPNGGSRHMLTAVRLKKEGVRAGVSDLFLAQPIQGFHGAFIEMKSREGTMQPAQREFHAAMERAGYRVKTCYGADDAIAFIQGYLGR